MCRLAMEAGGESVQIEEKVTVRGRQRKEVEVRAGEATKRAKGRL